MEESVRKVIKYMLIASFLFAVAAAFAKHLSSSMSSVEIVFFRNVFGVFIILYSVYKRPLKQIGGKPWLLFFRGFIGFVSLLFFFYTIAVIPLAEAITFAKTSTVFSAVFAFIFVNERLSAKGWIGIFVGFIGILFITQVSGEGLDKADYLAILSGAGAGLAYTSIRELGKFYDSRTIVLSFMIVGTVGPIILMAIGNFYYNEAIDFIISPFVLPSYNDYIFIILLGVVSSYAQVYMTKAYGFAKTGIIGTISYSNIAFSIILGLALGDAFPDVWVIIGISLIVVSGILVSKK